MPRFVQRHSAGRYESGGVIRVTLVQPVVPEYRIPLFERLARRPDLQLLVRAGMVSPGAPATPPRALSADFELIQAPTRKVGPFFYQSAQWSAVCNPPCDVIILSWNTRYILLIPAVLRARLHHVPVVLWGHGTSTGRPDSGLRRWLRILVGGWAAVCVVYGERAAVQLRGRRRMRKKLIVAPNALDQRPMRLERLKLFSAPQRLHDFRDREGLSGKRLLIFVSRVTPERGLEMLLEAMVPVCAKVPTTRLVILGDGPEVPALTRATRRLGLTAHVRFVNGTYDEAILALWLTAARALVAPRAMGLNILHAFGYGLPVITSDDPIEHAPEYEYLADGVNSLLYRAGDAEDLAARMLDIVESDALHERLSTGARTTVAGHGITIQRTEEGVYSAVRSAVASRQSGTLRRGLQRQGKTASNQEGAQV